MIAFQKHKISASQQKKNPPSRKIKISLSTARFVQRNNDEWTASSITKIRKNNYPISTIVPIPRKCQNFAAKAYFENYNDRETKNFKK